MPDQTAKGPPSLAPLSVEDADRLAESFTPFWEDDDLPGPAEVSAPGAAPDPSPVKAASKHTLLGLAPVLVAPASATVTPLMPAVAALQGLHQKTLLGFSPPIAPVPVPLAASAPAPVGPAAPTAVQGALEVPGYAAKYTPKDGPATPAVVIAPEAQSSPDAAKRPLSVTQPSRVRAAPARLAQPALAEATTDELDDLYPPKRKRGAVLFASAAAVLLLLGTVLGIRALSHVGSTASSTDALAPTALATVDAPTPLVAAPSAEPRPEAVPAVTPLPNSAPPAAAPVRTKAARSKTQVAPRPTPRPAAPTSPAGDGAAPASKAGSGKSVIVRDSPF